MNPQMFIHRPSKAACLAVLGFLAWGVQVFAEEPAETKVTAVRNQVTQSTGSTNTAVDVGHTVKPGQVVETGEQGLAELKSTDATTVRVGEESRVSYDPQERMVKMEKGTVVVDAPPGGGPVKIDLGGATYTVTTEDANPEQTNRPTTHDAGKKTTLSQTNQTNTKDQSVKNSK